MIINVSKTKRIRSYSHGWMLETDQPGDKTKTDKPKRRWSGNTTYHSNPISALEAAFEYELRELPDSAPLSEILNSVDDLFKQYSKVADGLFNMQYKTKYDEFLEIVTDILCRRGDVSNDNKTKLQKIIQKLKK